MWMRDAVRREKFPEIDKLDDPRYFPYRYGHAFWAFIGGKYGDRTVGNLLRAGVGQNGYKAAFERVLGVSSKELSQQWHDATVAAYRPVAETTKLPASFARPLIVDASKKGGLNVSPELSPGRFEDRVLLRRATSSRSISMWPTRRPGRSSARSPTTPRIRIIDSIGFIDSAGAWSRDGARASSSPASAAASPC